MKHSLIEGSKSWAEFLIVRMLRRWTAARDAHQSALPSLVQLAGEMAQAPSVAIALDSVFYLTEALLGRTLETECCCGRELSSDERAIILLVTIARPEKPTRTSRSIPHGLPSVLGWAAWSARVALHLPVPGKHIERLLPFCPFARLND